MAKKKRNKAKRRYVNRNERHGPTRETIAKLPVDPFVPWAALGEANGGLEHQQVTALLNLADAFMSVTAKLGYKPMVFQWQAPGAPRDMTAGEARSWTVWFAFAIAFERMHGTTGFKIAQWVIKRDHRGKADEKADPLLPQAARLWTTVADDYGKGIDVSSVDYHPGVARETPAEGPARIRTWVQPQTQPA